MTFTDSTGKADVVSIGGNGTYSANLSNLANGTLTYLMTVSNPAGNVINVDPTATLGDGSANAPAGTPEFPNLLNGYAVRPSREVAGVDYYVGVPANAVLSDPSTLSSNPNISVNSSTHQISAYGSGYTISNINFSLDGGWQLILHGSNITVEDCNFAIGSNGNAMLNDNVGGINNTIQYSTFNANGLTDNYNDADIYILGPATVEYCRIENASSDLVDVGGSGSSVQDITLKYNLLVNAGQASGTHPDWLQLGGGTYTVDVESNTFYQTAAVNGPGTQGIFTDAGNNGASLVGANIISNNTIVTLAGARVNYAIGALASSGSGNTFSISNNYIDPTGVGDSVFKYTSSQNTQTDNVNMVTGALVGQNATSVTQPPSDPELISIMESPASGDLNAGKTVTLKLNLNGAVTVTGGTPTLTLNDGGTATYTGGSGSNALTFSYTVGAGQNTAALAATAVNLNSATITDSAGNAANLSLSGLTQSGPQIDTTTPTIASLAESPSTGDLSAGKTVTFTLNLNEAVTVLAAPRRSPSTTAAPPPIRAAPAATRLPSATPSAAAEHRKPGRDRRQSQLRHRHRRCRQCRQPVTHRPDPERPADRHHNADHLVLTESPAKGDLNAGKYVTITLDMSEAVMANTTAARRRSRSTTAASPPTPAAPAAMRSPSATSSAPGRTLQASPPPPSISIRRPSPTAPAMPPTSHSPA